jgi:hypothetical protein
LRSVLAIRGLLRFGSAVHLLPPITVDFQISPLAIIEIQSLFLSAQLRLKIAALHAKAAEADRNREVARKNFSEAAEILGRFSVLGNRPTGQ